MKKHYDIHLGVFLFVIRFYLYLVMQCIFTIPCKEKESLLQSITNEAKLTFSIPLNFYIRPRNSA